MKIFVVLFCIAAASNAIPLTDSTKEVLASKFDSNGPQPVDEVIAITNGEDEKSSKRVARHYGFGGVSVGFGVPVAYPVSYPVYYGGGYPYYGGGGYPYYGGGYGGGYYGGGYGGGYYGGGYGRGWGHHHHHHHHRW